MIKVTATNNQYLVRSIDHIIRTAILPCPLVFRLMRFWNKTNRIGEPYPGVTGPRVPANLTGYPAGTRFPGRVMSQVLRGYQLRAGTRWSAAVSSSEVFYYPELLGGVGIVH